MFTIDTFNLGSPEKSGLGRSRKRLRRLSLVYHQPHVGQGASPTRTAVGIGGAGHVSQRGDSFCVLRLKARGHRELVAVVGPTSNGGERGKEGVKARPRIQRELLRWLSGNRQRFAVPIRISRRTDRWIEMAFVGANPILSATLTRWGINIAVEWQGECWDFVESHETGAVGQRVRIFLHSLRSRSLSIYQAVKRLGGTTFSRRF